VQTGTGCAARGMEAIAVHQAIAAGEGRWVVHEQAGRSQSMTPRAFVLPRAEGTPVPAGSRFRAPARLAVVAPDDEIPAPTQA